MSYDSQGEMYISQREHFVSDKYDKIALTRPPLARLPPELLALVFGRLDKEERTLCTMARLRWSELIKGRWPESKTNPDALLYWASNRGNLPLMKYAKEWGATRFNMALCFAAIGGHKDCLGLLTEWGATSFNVAARCAAQYW